MGEKTLEELQAENEQLKEKLREKVWTMALATVSQMEKNLGGAASSEKVTLPNRIAALERAVFGQSASSDDLDRIASMEIEYQQLQQDYVTLCDEYKKLEDQPPVVIQKEDKRADFLEEQLGRMQEQYQAMQMKLNKMRVEHLELQAAHRDLAEQFAVVKSEAEKVEKQLTDQLRVLRETHARVGQELQALRTAHGEQKKQLEQVKEEKMKLFKELQEQKEQAEQVEQLRSDYESLLGSFHRLQEDHDALVEKNDRLRQTVSEAWSPNQVNSTQRAGKALLPPLTPNSRCHTPQSPDNLEHKFVGLEGLEEFSKEVRFPACLLEPKGPLSVVQLKTRLMEIQGRVLYCSDEFEEKREPGQSRRSPYAIYHVDDLT